MVQVGRQQGPTSTSSSLLPTPSSLRAQRGWEEVWDPQTTPIILSVLCAGHMEERPISMRTQCFAGIKKASVSPALACPQNKHGTSSVRLTNPLPSQGRAAPSKARPWGLSGPVGVNPQARGATKGPDD